jgi:putative tricarboxylic transport membrane protein
MAVGVIGLGLFFLFGAWAIAVLPSYARIGPRFFPYIVGSGLLGAGLLLLWQAVRAPKHAVPEVPEDWAAVSRITTGLVLNVALMEWAGYILVTTLLFILAARGLGSRRYVTSALAGFILALTTHLAFTRLLDLRLPAGLLEIVIS